MYYLRLARGYRALDLSRWLLTATASAVVAGFLLRALGRALSDPGGPTLLRLLWCVPPLVDVAWFAAIAARAVPEQHPERIAGLTAAGAGPGRVRALIAGEVALASVVGGAATLLLFLVLRNDIAGPSLATDLGMGIPLPPAAPIALLTVEPLVAGVAAALAVDSAEALPGTSGQPVERPFHPLRLALPIGVLAVGIALEAYGRRSGAPQDGRPLDLPARLGTTSPALLVGWMLAALGLALLTGPLLKLAGRLLVLGRPAPLRLLAGRGLSAQASRLGAPLSVLTLVLAIVLTTARQWNGQRDGADPLPTIEAVLLVACAVAAVVARLIEVRALRRGVNDSLLRLGTPPGLLAGALALRTLAVGTVLLVTGGLTAGLLASALG